MKKLLAFLVTSMLLVSVMAPLAMAADDGFVDGKFTETRHITVEIFDRSTDGTVVDDNTYTDFIKKGMLDQYNVEVEFVTVPRWEEANLIPTYLAAGSAPDVSYTYNDGAVYTYFMQDAVLDLQPLIDEYIDYIPDLYDLLGEANMTWKLNPYTGTNYAICARRMNVARINTFIREDWLAMLGLAVPTTMEEFEAALYAFKENAEMLLGEDADKIVPLP